MRLVFILKRIHVTQSYSNKNCKTYVGNGSHTKVFRLLDYQYAMKPFFEIFSELQLKRL